VNEFDEWIGLVCVGRDWMDGISIVLGGLHGWIGFVWFGINWMDGIELVWMDWMTSFDWFCLGNNCIYEFVFFWDELDG